MCCINRIPSFDSNVEREGGEREWEWEEGNGLGYYEKKIETEWRREIVSCIRQHPYCDGGCSFLKREKKSRIIRKDQWPLLTQRAASAASLEEAERREHVLVQRFFTKVRKRFQTFIIQNVTIHLTIPFILPLIRYLAVLGQYLGRHPLCLYSGLKTEASHNDLLERDCAIQFSGIIIWEYLG